MNSVQPYIRQVELTIGPLPDYMGGGDQAKAVRIFSDGSQNGLRVRFSIRKHIVSTASPSQIFLYNLSPATRRALHRSGTAMTLRAGWANTALPIIFSGGLLAATHQREGSDIVTTLISLPGGGVSRSIVSRTDAGGTRLRDLVIDLAKQLPGVTIDPKLIDIRDVAIGAQGTSFAGPTSEYLDKLARVHGFSWTIVDGVFQAGDDRKSFPTGVVISSANGTLKRAEPMLMTPMQLQAGVTITSILNPWVQPGRDVKLISDLNPRLNGTYKAHTLAHSGDTHSSQWETTTETWQVML